MAYHFIGKIHSSLYEGDSIEVAVIGEEINLEVNDDDGETKDIYYTLEEAKAFIEAIEKGMRILSKDQLDKL